MTAVLSSEIALDKAIIKMKMTKHFRMVVVMMDLSIVFQECSTGLLDWQMSLKSCLNEGVLLAGSRGLREEEVVLRELSHRHFFGN